jgi:hypothetical protein
VFGEQKFRFGISLSKWGVFLGFHKSSDFKPGFKVQLNGATLDVGVRSGGVCGSFEKLKLDERLRCVFGWYL